MEKRTSKDVKMAFMQKSRSNLTRGAALFLGPPPSGKTSLAVKVAGLGPITPLQVGTLLKEQSRQDTWQGHLVRPFLEKNELLPNELVESAIRTRLEQDTKLVIEIFDQKFPQLMYKPSGQTPAPAAADRIAHWLEIEQPSAMN